MMERIQFEENVFRRTILWNPEVLFQQNHNESDEED